MFRLTKSNREKVLEMNEGFTARTYYSDDNSRESREYRIEGGKLHVHAVGKGAWGGSQYDEEWVADEEATHRFLYKHLNELDH